MQPLAYYIQNGFELKATSSYVVNGQEITFVYVQNAYDVFVCKFQVNDQGVLVQFATQQIA